MRRKKTPEILAELERLMAPATAGDSITGLKWTRKTTAKVSQELKQRGFHACAQTVARLLDRLDHALRVNHKKLSQGSANVSNNWAGEPLVSLETMLNFIRTTKTQTGLRVKAALNRSQYPTGVKPSSQEMKNLNLIAHELLPKRNYTLAARASIM